jgi:serine/threonine protein kinase
MIGRNLAHYEVGEKLGAGGMGEVYRASDTRLRRDVALKVLPDIFAHDGERMARFQREAQVLASLNHPNIGAIYGLEELEGRRALVLELIEGMTLEERIRRGRVPLAEALPIARQIAEALEAAHERGIIHRDLKPANVKITPDGTVKVLDFGLAKALMGEGDPGESVMTESPTITGMMTGANVILGTAAYMSPEQARGSGADKRSDVWAFGVLLYEMLTGKASFAGDTVSDTLAAVLKDKVDWEALPRETPRRVRRLLERCLERDPKQRLKDIGEARIAIDDVLSGADDEPETTARPAISRPLVAAALAAALVIGTAAGWFLRSSPSREPGAVRRFEISVPDLDTNDASGMTISLSPSGERIAYTSQSMIWVREFARLEPRAVAGTEGGAMPFWSPDEAWLAFGAENRLWKVPVAGGERQAICSIEDDFSPASGGVWQKDGTIVFCTGSGPLLQVSEKGGDPDTLLALAEGELDFHNVTRLPDGRGYAFVVHRNEGYDTIDALLDGRRRRVIQLPTQSLVDPVVDPAGFLVYKRTPDNPGIWAQPLSLSTLKPSAPPFIVIPGAQRPDVSASGTLVYAQETGSHTARLARVDAGGRKLGTIGPEQAFSVFPVLSPDGGRVVLTVNEEGNSDLWVMDIARGTRSRLTFDEEQDFWPCWSPDGSRIYYTHGTGLGNFEVLVRPSDGTGAARTVTSGVRGMLTPVGKELLVERTEDGSDWDAWYAPLGADGLLAESLQVYLDTSKIERGFRFSPDGRYVVYESNESGHGQIYVRPFPGGEGKWQVSVDGGQWPHWGKSGKRIYWAQGQDIMTVDVETDPAVRLGSPELLMSRSPSGITMPWGWAEDFDVSPDESWFVIAVEGDRSPRDAETIHRGIVVMENWRSAFSSD